VSNDATVEDLKREIENQQKLPSDRFVFILDTDERTVITKEEEKVSLLDYGIQDGSRIYLFFTPLDDDSTENFRLTYLDFDNIG